MLPQSEIDAIKQEALKIFKAEFFKSIIESGQSEKYAEDMWLIWWKLSSNAIKRGALNGISKIITEERQRAKVLLKQEAIGFAKWYLGYKKKRMSEAPTKKGFAYWANKPIEEYYDDYIQTPIKKQAK